MSDLKELIERELESFIEWDGDDKSIVTTTSAKLFAEHVAGLWADHVAGARKMVAAVQGEPVAWSGWGCQYPGKMPRLYGDRRIAELNCDWENGDRVLHLTAAPQPAPAVQGEPGVKWAPEEVANGNKGIRWVSDEGVHGRPTDHDCRVYLESNPNARGCHCPECTTLYTTPQPAEQQREPCHECGGNGAGGEHEEDCSQQVAPDVTQLVAALEDMVSEIESNTCPHDNTYRGGAIWEICEDCGKKWADDMGGKPEFVWPESVETARNLIHAYRKQGGGK